MNVEWLLLAFFFPLFPFSAVFMLLYKKLANSWLKIGLLLVWPMIGLLLVNQLDIALTESLQYWAVLTSVFYAVRSLVLRDLGLWIGFIAVSVWSLLWTVGINHEFNQALLYVLGFSLPLAILSLLGSELLKRFDSMYAGLIGGIADALPRLSRMLVIAVLAVIATPVFPGFFTMLTSIIEQFPVLPAVAVGLVTSWFFWTWSGIRLLQGLITGPAMDNATQDIGMLSTLLYGGSLAAIALLGLLGIGGL